MRLSTRAGAAGAHATAAYPGTEAKCRPRAASAPLQAFLQQGSQIQRAHLQGLQLAACIVQHLLDHRVHAFDVRHHPGRPVVRERNSARRRRPVRGVRRSCATAASIWVMSCAWTRRRSRPVLSRRPASALSVGHRREWRLGLQVDACARFGQAPQRAPPTGSTPTPPNASRIARQQGEQSPGGARPPGHYGRCRHPPAAVGLGIPSSNGGHCIAVSSAACDFSTPARPEASSTAPPR